MANKYGLIGYPLGHSFSRQYHNERFVRDGVDAVYCNYELTEISQLPELIAHEKSLRGLNVTTPYKQAVIPYLDTLDDTARRIGAVNVIRIERSSNVVRTMGFNSDYTGFRNSLTPLLQSHHKKAIVLGSGGASKAVCAALCDMNIAVTLVSRTEGNNRLQYEQLDADIMATHTIVVNTTPLGMHPHTDKYPPIPYPYITPRHLCYDLVYNPSYTMFMQLCAEQGATVCNGLKMLHEQADAAWDIWNR